METTLNIHINILKKIAEAAQLQGIPRSSMIILLLQKVMGENLQPIVIGKLVRYQKRSRPEDWHAFHVQLREDEYEYFLDLRKFRKMSVSLILAYAVKKYLRNLYNKNGTDNNRSQYKNYVVVKEFIDRIPSWKLIWGYPPKVEQYF